MFLNDPSNTKTGALITDGDRVSASPIQVQLVDDLGSPVTHFPMAVTFVFGSDPSEGAATLTVGTETTDANGVATFDDETPAAEGGDGLEINLANVAAFSDFTLVPRGSVLTSITGAPSTGFDIWQDASLCNGANCTLSHDGDEYVVPGGQAGALLSASTFSTSESEHQLRRLHGDHRATSSGTSTPARPPVLVKIHITRAEMKASSNNGQARVEVCVGLLDEGTLTGQQKWAALGVTADHQDSDGDGLDDIWVALAPRVRTRTRRDRRRASPGSTETGTAAAGPRRGSRAETRPAVPDPDPNDLRKRAPGPSGAGRTLVRCRPVPAAVRRTRIASGCAACAARSWPPPRSSPRRSARPSRWSSPT